MRIALAALFVAWAAPAHAQITPRTPRPDWGLFGSGVSNTEQRLVLTASFGAGYEDDLTKVPVTDPPAPRPAYTGQFGTANAALSYSVDREGVRGGVSFGVAGRNYGQQEEQSFIGTYSINGNIARDVGSRGTLSGSIWAGEYLQNLAPGYDAGHGGPVYPGVPAAPGQPGVYTSGDTYLGLGSNVSYNHRFATKVSAYGSVSYYTNDAWKDADVVGTTGRYGSSNVNAGIRYAIGKGLSARAGYGATLGGYGEGDLEYRSRNIDFGVDYTGSLSPTRRSTVTFSSGVSGLDDLAGTTHYYFVGNVNYNYEIGRTWSAGIGARRSTDFYQTLGQPSVTDSVDGTIGGSIGRRVTISFGGGWYRGAYAGAESRAYTSTSGTATFQYAISRMWSLSTNYYYYHYVYAEDVVLPPGYSRAIDRQSVRVTLNMFLPLYTKARRLNAAR